MFNGTNMPGSTSSSLGLSNVQSNNSGGYCVVVTNSAGSVTSFVASLTVLTPPSITLQPNDQTVVTGTNVTFQGAAAGSAPIHYQWLFGGSALSGQTVTPLSLTNVQAAQAGNYSFIVTNSAGAATSSVAHLTVLIPPAITSQPTNQSVIVGGAVSFQASASGTSPLTYQWCFNATNAIGTDTNILTLQSAQVSDSGGYSLVVSNSAGSITSLVASLTVGTPPGVSQQPANQVIVQGQTATFNLAVTGDAPLTYQWRFNSTPLAGGTSSGYSVTGATTANAGNYDAIITNAYGAITTQVAQLTVLVPPSLSNQPSNQIVVVGSNALFQAVATGSSPLHYQWWFNNTNAVGGNTNGLVLSNVQTSQAGGYSLVVTNSAGSITSVVANLTVGTPPAVVSGPNNLTVIQGQGATFSLNVTGDAPLNYQWRFNGAPVGGATASSYTIPGVTSSNAGNYDAVVSNSYGSATSAVALLTVILPPVITSQPTNQTVTVGTNVSFQVGSSGTAPFAFQWWFNGTNAVGANTNVLTLANVQSSQAGAYYVTITNAAGSITSSVAQLIVLLPPSIVNPPTNQTTVLGGNVGFNATATGSAPLAYQWSFNGAALAGATTSNLSLTNVLAGQTGTYSLVVSNAAGSATAYAQLKVLVPPVLQSPVLTGSKISVSFSSLATLNYQLEYKDSLQDPTWTPVTFWQAGTGGVLVLQDTNSVSASRFYRVSCQ
jgi:hypothetical protein